MSNKVEEIFVYTTPPGVPFVQLHQWVETLSVDEQTEFFEAVKRQQQYRQQAIDSGILLQVLDGKYIWNGEENVNNKDFDPIWRSYFDRWREENQITFTTVINKL